MRGSHVIHALPLEPQLPLGVSQALEKLLADRAPLVALVEMRAGPA
jgi:hypothetical protein